MANRTQTHARAQCEEEEEEHVKEEKKKKQVKS